METCYLHKFIYCIKIVKVLLKDARFKKGKDELNIQLKELLSRTYTGKKSLQKIIGIKLQSCLKEFSVLKTRKCL